MATTILKDLKQRLEIVDDVWDLKLLATLNDVGAVALHNGYQIELPITRASILPTTNKATANQFFLRACQAKAIQQLDPTAYPSLFTFTDKEYYEALAMLRLEASLDA